MLSFILFLLNIAQPADFHTSAPARIIQHQKAVAVTLKNENNININQPKWNGHFSAKKFKNNTVDRTKLISTKRNIRKALQMLPKEHSKSLKDLEIRNITHQSRGMANHEKMILHIKSIDTNDELLSVFIHELGHIVDLGVLKGKHGRPTPFKDFNSVIRTDDPSFYFYRLSWVDSQTQKSKSIKDDFISGYAKTNCFEDFAESYLMYRLHGEKFRYKMENSIVLRQKYNFMKQRVFNNKEFQLEKPKITTIASIWDATLIIN